MTTQGPDTPDGDPTDEDTKVETSIFQEDEGGETEETRGKPTSRLRGALAYMARNSVAANVLMIVLLVGGMLKLSDIKQEVFPSFTLDKIIVQVPYPSASNPEVIRDNIIKLAEPELRNIDGVDRVTATAAEGIGVLTVDLLLGADAAQAENDVRSAMGRVRLPEEAREEMVVARAKNDYQVTALVIYGELDDPDLSPDQRREQTRRILKRLADKAKTDLELDDRVSRTKLGGLPPMEISIEVPQENLRRYGLTVPRVAELIDAASVEVPVGKIRSPAGDMNVRVKEKRQDDQGFADVPILATPSGSPVTVADIAGGYHNIKDTFEDKGQSATFNGKPAVMVTVFQVGQEKPLDVAAAAEEYIERLQNELPPGFKVAKWMDMSEMYEQRVDLLVKNAALGLILVLIVLGLFLEVRVAFWVTLGIPISFVGAFIFLPSTDVSVNMISLFAFIIVLGMVVDDAIIVGETIFTNRQRGMSGLRAAILGVKEVAVPVVFAIITTMLAYAPMLFIPGVMGKFFRVIPIVVILVLFMSLIESLLILPAHLAHLKKRDQSKGIFAFITRRQNQFANWFERFVVNRYVPFARKVIRRRYLTLATGLALLIVSCGTVAGGRVQTVFFPKLEDDILIVYAEMVPGTSIETSRRYEKLLVDSAKDILEENGGFEESTRGLFSQVGISTIAALRQPDQSGRFPEGSHIVEAAVYFKPMGVRKISPTEVTRQWNQRVANFPGLRKLTFMNEAGPAQGADIDIVLRHRDMDTLRDAGEKLAARIAEFSGTREIDDGYVDGAPEINLELDPSATQQGLTAGSLAAQVRGAFYGVELKETIARGEDEVKVYVRLPREERVSEQQLDDLVIRTPRGGEMLLSEAVAEQRGASYTSIQRIDGSNAISVQAKVDPAVNNADNLNKQLFTEVLPKMARDIPGLGFEAGGSVREQSQTSGSLFTGFIMALIAIFALMAVVFRSYLQPVIIMVAIPFGFVGALIGHVIMGYELSLMSFMGIVALAGVVVNDSLILIVSINRLREQGMDRIDAIVTGSARRFRPILLTSLTTFFGLVPMIVETSMQARFLIPMAISLGFGVMFATFITLVFIPALYEAIEETKEALARFFRGEKKGGQEQQREYAENHG